jgi:hypothetical protein
MSAAKMSGFDRESINLMRIMSHNKEFVELSASRAAEVISTIENVLSPYWWRHGLIHENIFDEVFEGETDIDTLCNQTGKPLNDLSTNRQKMMLDNHDEWKAELERRRLAIESENDEKIRKAALRAAIAAAKPKKNRKCSDLECEEIIDISTSALKTANEKLWRKCVGKNCSTWACPLHFNKIANHEDRCEKVSRE